MTLRSVARRVRSALRRRREPGEAYRWRSYLTAVEPALAAETRVHRFARPPMLGDSHTATPPMAVWIDGDGAAAERTRASLTESTVAAATVLAGPLSEALSQTRAERVVLVRAGVVIAPLALERLSQAVTLAPDCTVISCDEDELDPNGVRRAPHFRPGPSPDRWLACDDSGGLLAVSRTAAATAIGDVAGADQWTHALAVSLAGPDAQRHAHVPLLLAHRTTDGPVAGVNRAETVAAALTAWEPLARIELTGGVRRIRRPIAGEPSVQVIICFRDRADLTARCVDSLLAVTGYERFGVTLVDNGSARSNTAVLLTRLDRDARVTVRRDDRPFNFAALNNGAARATDADLLVFLNNDTVVIDPVWMETLIEEAQRPVVGAVAPLMLFPDETVQQAGAALGMHGYAGHPFAGLSPDAPTPFGHAAQGTRNWLAVSAACVMVERCKFEAVGGFDEGFVVAGNDVDLCLRLTASGYRSLCVPHARLLHDESRSRGEYIDPGDFAASERSYGAFRTVGDPFYNPSLSLRATDCRVRTPGEEPG